MNTIEHAAKEGARYASHHGSQSIDPKTDQEIGDYIKQKAVGVDSTDVTVQVQWNPDDAPGSVVVINVTYPFRLMYASVLSTDPYDLTARSTYTVSR